MSIQRVQNVNLSEVSEIKAKPADTQETAMNSVWENNQQGGAQLVGYKDKRDQQLSCYQEAKANGDTKRMQDLDNRWHFTDAEKAKKVDDSYGNHWYDGIVDGIKNAFGGKSLRDSIDDADGNNVNHIFKPKQFEKGEKAVK